MSPSSAKDAALTRKAYSSPVQRTRSVDTELCQLHSAVEGKALETQSSHCTDTDSGINEGATISVNLMLSKTNEEIAKNSLTTAEVAFNGPCGRNVVNLGSLEENRNRQIIREKSFQKDEDSTHTCIKMSKPKSKNPFAPAESKSNSKVAHTENSSQDPQLEVSAFGPALKNNKNSRDKSACKLQVQKENDISLNIMETFACNNVKKDSKQIAKHDVYINSSLLFLNPVVHDSGVSVSESELTVEHTTDTKPQNLIVTQQPPTKDVVIPVTPVTEIKTKNTQAEKCVTARKKSKSEYKDVISAAEEKWSYIQSILNVLNSLAGKGKSVIVFVLNCY